MVYEVPLAKEDAPQAQTTPENRLALREEDPVRTEKVTGVEPPKEDWLTRLAAAVDTKNATAESSRSLIPYTDRTGKEEEEELDRGYYGGDKKVAREAEKQEAIERPVYGPYTDPYLTLPLTPLLSPTPTPSSSPLR